MKFYKIEAFTKGWIVGDFQPSLYENTTMEVSVKFFSTGELEPAHSQKTATEITIISSGTISFNGMEFNTGDIVVIEPGEVTNFRSITNSTVTCIKFPSIPNDKVLT